MSRSPASVHERGSLTGRRVLIVEDEYFLADDIVHAFRALGAQVCGPFGSLDEALATVNSGEMLDGAVLDVNLRSEMIYPLARALRGQRVPFVFTTGYDRTAIAAEFDNVPLWEKPLDIQAMVRGLAGLIERPV